MKLFFNIVLYSLIGLIALGAVLGGLAYYGMSYRPTSPVIVQTSAPTTRELAVKRCPISLPESARSIQYASIKPDWMSEIVFVRFEASLSDCYACASSLFERYPHNQSTFQPISHPESIKQRTRFCPQWFDLDRDSEWVIAGKGVSLQPKIWIDTKLGVFYFFLPIGLD